MLYHYMKEKHNPPVSYGDCLRACVASILEIELLDEVPHFMGDGCEDPDELYSRVVRFAMLKRRAMPFVLAYSGEMALGDLLATMADNNPDINFILFGTTFDGTPHASICRNGKIVHDPSPWPGGIVAPSADGIWAIMVFVCSVLTNE